MIKSVLLLSILFCISASVAEYVRTPGGLVWSSCLHHVKNGAHVQVDENNRITVTEGVSVRKIPKCSKPTIFNRPRGRMQDNKLFQQQTQTEAATKPNDGWQVWTTYDNANNATFDSFLSYFTVPAAPTQWRGDGIVYIFPGLQNDDWYPVGDDFHTAPLNFDIIQPVLQYGGGSANGGGAYWGVASWYVTEDDGAIWSDELTVKPGDNIFGNMTKVSADAWYIGTVLPDGTATAFTVSKSRLLTQSWAYVTLEAYSIESCSYFPPSGSTSEFTKMVLTGAHGEVSAEWYPLSNPGGHCSTNTTIHSSDYVTISF